MPPPVIGALPPQVSGPFPDLLTNVSFYTVSVDASGSWSASNPPDQLIFAWSDAFGGTGTLPSYSFVVTTAQLGTQASTNLTLTVTDPQGLSTTGTVVVTFAATVIPTIVVGQSSGCTYTSDNGAHWTTFGPQSAVVPPRFPPSTIMAGFGDGTLRTPSATLYQFPSSITSFFVNPANPARILIGLNNGDVWRSLDTGATWTLLVSFGARIPQVIEASDAIATYVVADTLIWQSRRSFFDTPVVWTQFTAPARATRMVLGAWGNYGCSSIGTVRNVDTGGVLSGPASSITGIAYNPRHGTLWVAESNGPFWRMKQGDSALAQISSIPGGGGRLAPITPIPGAILTGNDTGAYMSPDAGLTWRKLLAGATSSIGYYSPAVPGTY